MAQRLSLLLNRRSFPRLEFAKHSTVWKILPSRGRDPLYRKKHSTIATVLVARGGRKLEEAAAQLGLEECHGLPPDSAWTSLVGALLGRMLEKRRDAARSRLGKPCPSHWQISSKVQEQPLRKFSLQALQP